jgi:hypothetical protein
MAENVTKKYLVTWTKDHNTIQSFMNDLDLQKWSKSLQPDRVYK